MSVSVCVYTYENIYILDTHIICIYTYIYVGDYRERERERERERQRVRACVCNLLKSYILRAIQKRIQRLAGIKPILATFSIPLATSAS